MYMAIIYDGKIYGIRWEIFDEFGDFLKEYEQNDIREMTPEDIRDIKTEYDKLTEHEKHHGKYYFLMGCQEALDCRNIYGFNTVYKIAIVPVNRHKLEHFIRGTVGSINQNASHSGY